MDTNDLAVGDVVKLRSGGHQMTVQGFEKANGDIVAAGADRSDFRVRTVWTDETGKMHTSHGLVPEMLESVSKVERHESDDEKPQEGTDGVQRAIDRQDGNGGPQGARQEHEAWLADRRTPGMGNEWNNSHSGLNRPPSPQKQSENREAVHEGDEMPQSLGNENERQPAQEAEIAHARMTDDRLDDRGTTHEVGKHYQRDTSLKDNR